MKDHFLRFFLPCLVLLIAFVPAKWAIQGKHEILEVCDGDEAGGIGVIGAPAVEAFGSKGRSEHLSRLVAGLKVPIENDRDEEVQENQRQQKRVGDKVEPSQLLLDATPLWLEPRIPILLVSGRS